MIQSLEQLVCIICDPEEPYILRHLDDIAVADVTLTALRILVGQDYLAVRAVIDQRLRAEHEPVLKQLEKDPLRPLIVIRSGGSELS